MRSTLVHACMLACLLLPGDCTQAPGRGAAHGPGRLMCQLPRTFPSSSTSTTVPCTASRLECRSSPRARVTTATPRQQAQMEQTGRQAGRQEGRQAGRQAGITPGGLCGGAAAGTPCGHMWTVSEAGDACIGRLISRFCPARATPTRELLCMLTQPHHVGHALRKGAGAVHAAHGCARGPRCVQAVDLIADA
jgi:hypothetical protein